MRKNLGQAVDRKRACKGLHQLKVQLYRNFFAATSMLKECMLVVLRKTGRNRHEFGVKRGQKPMKELS